ncbi:MAG: hypothetical protein EA422_11050 [Gemmatimonadales bacterium]|nr:MAG: hypothetical protein EA422_11050 [Gemmatimonadales bacterium]
MVLILSFDLLSIGELDACPHEREQLRTVQPPPRDASPTGRTEPAEGSPMFVPIIVSITSDREVDRGGQWRLNC